MIRVTVELCPRGDTRKAVTIGTAELVNTTSVQHGGPQAGQQRYVCTIAGMSGQQDPEQVLALEVTMPEPADIDIGGAWAVLHAALHKVFSNADLVGTMSARLRAR